MKKLNKKAAAGIGLGAETEIKAATDACKELTNGLGKIRAKLSAE